jgi:two-component system cell cycle response regulator DivK
MNEEGALLLAVEDEPRNAALLEAILGRSGYRLRIAGDLAEARELLEETTPALVLLDRHLPDGDGLDLIPEIRGSERLGDVPILLVSASVLPSDVQAAMDAGCDGFLAKPVRVKPLVDEVRRLLELEPAVDAAGPKLAD